MIDNHKLVNLDAECAVLGSILVHNKVIERCSDFLESEHFADPVNGRIYEACLSIIRNGEEATPSSINRHLKEIEKCQDEEIEDFLVRLKEQTVTCLNARDYALQIFNLASRRLIVAVLDKYREELMGDLLDDEHIKIVEKIKDDLDGMNLAKINKFYKVYEKHFDRLYAIREDMQTGTAANVFVPYIGRDYFQSSPRLMILGKATYSWENDSDKTKLLSYKESREQAEKFCTEAVPGKGSTKKYSSPFWHFLTEIGRELHNVNDIKKLMDRVAWSNLMKISGPMGNPKGNLARAQKQACICALKCELEHLRPSCILLVTGNDYWNIAAEVFGADEEWTTEKGNGKPITVDEKLWWKQLPPEYGDGRVYWTRHPQGWKIEYRKQAERFIVGDQQ